MESSRNRSAFHSIASRELNGFRVRKRPCFADDSSAFRRMGAFDYGVEYEISSPLASSFCKTSKNAHILAVTGEDGYVGLYNTRVQFASSSTNAENAEKARKYEWLAHDNAVFDVCWIKDDTNMLTACGDHSIKLWDSEERKCILWLTGHTGSVKSISPHPSNHGSAKYGKIIRKIANVQGAHTPSNVKRRGRHNKAASKIVTSVLYMNDELSIATAGAVDSVVKFWDTRNLKAPINQACSQDKPSQKWARSYGISSLSQDLNGVYMSASCMDNRIYLFNVLQLEKGPIKTFEGCNIGNFFVKSKLSPDAGQLLSGSSDGSAYVWQVNKPQDNPIKLRGHDRDVTAVDWSSHEIGKIAISADDSMVQLWKINSSCYSTTRSPSSIQRRERTTVPFMKRRKLLFTQDRIPVKSMVLTDSPKAASTPEMKTPEAAKKQELLISSHVGDM